MPRRVTVMTDEELTKVIDENCAKLGITLRSGKEQEKNAEAGCEK